MDIDALPQPPKITDEKLAEFDIEQAKLSSTHPVIHGGDIFLQRALAVITELAVLDVLNPHQSIDLSEAYATVGMYEMAAQCNPEKATEFLAIANASKDKCDCPRLQTVQMVNGKPEEVSFSQTYTVNNIYVNGEWIPLSKCNACGHLSK
jgi:hypothetical protein